MRHSLKCSVVLGVNGCRLGSDGKFGDAGDVSGLVPVEFDNEGVSALKECRGRYWACGWEFNAYIVRKGISYVPGYARRCSNIQGKADPSGIGEDDVLFGEDICEWCCSGNVCALMCIWSVRFFLFR